MTELVEMITSLILLGVLKVVTFGACNSEEEYTQCNFPSRTVWNGRPEKVTALYAKRVIALLQRLEYHETGEILWEASPTMR